MSLLSNFDEVRLLFARKTNSEFELILTSIYYPTESPIWLYFSDADNVPEAFFDKSFTKIWWNVK